jgi:hypothetical protein
LNLLKSRGLDLFSLRRQAEMLLPSPRDLRFDLHVQFGFGRVAFMAEQREVRLRVGACDDERYLVIE